MAPLRFLEFRHDSLILPPLNLQCPLLLVHLLLEFRHESICTHRNLFSHRISFCYCGLGKLAGVGSFFDKSSGFAIGVELIEEILDGKVETRLEIHIWQPPVHYDIAEDRIDELKQSQSILTIIVTD